MRVVKDLVLQRARAYNVCQLLVLLCEKLECYYRLRARSAFKLENSRLLPSIATPPLHLAAEIIPLDSDQYRVPSETQPHIKYTVDLAAGMCTCLAGQSGSLCKHQQWCVSMFAVKTLKTVLTPDSELRNTFYKIACGKDAPPGLFCFTNASLSPCPILPCENAAAIDDAQQNQLP